MIAPAAPHTADHVRLLGVAVITLLATMLWASAIADLEGTIEPQRFDLRQFHLPTVERFARLPVWEAVRDYNAAPFPLFYILNGAVFALTQSFASLRLVSFALALATLLIVWRLIAECHADRQQGATIAVLGFLAICPFFRGFTWWVTTDVLPLTATAAALLCERRYARSLHRGWMIAALASAFAAFYTRQFYVFLVAALAIRFIVFDARARVAAFVACAVLSLPGIALIGLWRGLVPPSFSQHEQPPYLAASLPYVLSMLGFYLSPLIVMTAWRHARDLRDALRQPAIAVPVAVLWLGYLAYFLSKDGSFIEAGGGMIAKAFQLLPLGGYRFHAMAAAASLMIPYIAYLTLQDWRRNLILPLFVLSFLPTGIIYQRYLDPLFLLLIAFAMKLRELDGLFSGRAALAYPGLEITVAAIAFVYYGRLFGIL